MRLMSTAAATLAIMASSAAAQSTGDDTATEGSVLGSTP